ncbi:MAG: class I SAM-dependent DNA methyltransferase, partial [Nocardioidaceae bacterium]
FPSTRAITARCIQAEWDERHEPPDTDDAVELLVELASGRAVLEFGVGTGRLALPLQDRGVRVHGVDNSSWMLEQLSRKPDGNRIPVTVGDFTSERVEGHFGLVLLAYTTIFALATQELQVECFRNAAAHLECGGLFVLDGEAVHDLAGHDGKCSVVSVAPDTLVLSASRVNVVSQEIFNAKVILRDGELPKIYPAASRYCSPSELDLMARLAGFRLRNRWGGWDKRAFTATSRFHVSVYERS